MKSRTCTSAFPRTLLAASLGLLCLACLTATAQGPQTGGAGRLASVPGFPDIDLPDGSDFPDIPDFDFPVLQMSNPMIGATGVAINSPIKFTFLTAMAPEQSITWSANVDPAKFSYAWSADGKVLTATYSGDLPANATINWTLEPAGFKSQSGTELLPVNNTGSFTTGSGTSNPEDPCNPPDDPTTGGINLFKGVYYVQNSASAPVIDPELGASFFATVIGPDTNAVTEASMQLPNGTTKTIPNVFGTFMLSDQFATQEALDSAYPAGTYKVTVKQATGTTTLDIQIGSKVPPVPQLSNYPATQTFNSGADFSLQWLPYTGATANDGIHLSVHQNDVYFDAPDLCVPRELKNTDTSIVIPANTFPQGGEKDGSLSFSAFGTGITNSAARFVTFSSYSKTTTFVLRNGNEPQPQAPQLLGLTRQANGSVQFQVKATAGASVIVEASTDLEVWTPVSTGTATGGIYNAVDAQASGMPYRFYRASAP